MEDMKTSFSACVASLLQDLQGVEKLHVLVYSCMAERESLFSVISLQVEQGMMSDLLQRQPPAIIPAGKSPDRPVALGAAAGCMHAEQPQSKS